MFVLHYIASKAPVFDDEEEDLAIIEKAHMEKLNTKSLRSKGKQCKAKADAKKERQEEEELARKAMELKAEMEANMTIDERRIMERKRNEDADLALAGGARGLVTAGRGNAMEAGDVVKFYSASRGM